MAGKGNMAEIVRAFLLAMQERDMARAEEFLADDFSMQFPGAPPFTALGELVEWSKDRYRMVAKDYERFDTCECDGEGIVYCYGTLFGEWLNGERFDGIRFIDRFALRDGKITDQKVWNDLEIHRPPASANV